ncbi:hypothetical protein COEREDRAFT_8047 [Coemansia reversa NRRL 1564]|uniref:Uncharacterized protein n=1 Tax=Coemansia reversa (strain ATCC 12441 / NRRL 1564) TaxID=763665 RepID=A0A2G5BD13_COERN|nr:hypothetical protein COEREDRAFT_8047 [Coemansia reversa NRRL 1564]|eukprot:PIA16900.1 hypothetical protein COEREDRAFT_8047 [Coemansia reversa NRRL 1564]
MNSPPGVAAVATLTATLTELETQQRSLITRLRHIYTQLSSEDNSKPEEELLTTLTYYINQASYIQRRMILIHGRVGDLKRRSERLKEHRAKQSKQVAEWMKQERERLVPAAFITSSAVDTSESPESATTEKLSTATVAVPLSSRVTDARLPSQQFARSMPVTPLLSGKDLHRPQSVLSSPSPLRVSTHATSIPAIASDDVELTTSQQHFYTAQHPGSPATSVGSRAATPLPAPSSPTPSTTSTLDSALVAHGSSAPIAMVKRKGKRRVRLPKIE